jgi:AcrR family transcriptional regulator
MSQAVTRAARYAADFEAAQESFIRLVESLSDAQWAMTGKNFPDRMNDEDEGRSVGVIADHVAQVEPFIVERIQVMLAGEVPSPVDFRAINAKHAAQHANVSQADVASRLRANQKRIADAVRAIPDAQLDAMRETPVGPMSIAQRLERVLIGHIKAHEGSIKAATSPT